MRKIEKIAGIWEFWQERCKIYHIFRLLLDCYAEIFFGPFLRQLFNFWLSWKFLVEILKAGKENPYVDTNWAKFGPSLGKNAF